MLSASPIGGNCPPTFDLSGIDTQIARVGSPLSLNIFDAGGSYNDEDGANDPRNLLLDPDPTDTPTGASLDASGDFRFTPTLDQLGTHRLIGIAIDDGTPALAAASFFMVEVRTGNDAPSFAIPNPTLSVDEDAGPQTLSGFATDISAGAADEANQTLSFVVQSNSNPDLFLSGPSISPTGELSYTTAENAFGDAEISVVLMDDGGTDNGGTDTSPAMTFTLSVNSINDAPVIAAPATIDVNEDDVVSVLNVAIADIDLDLPGSSGEVELALSTNDGTLTITTTQGLSFVTGDGSDDSEMVFSGLLADVNAALATLTYSPDADFFGTSTIAISADDLGNTGGGGARASSLNIDVTVASINDAPNWTAPDSVTIVGDAVTPVAGLTVADVDAADGDLSVTLTVADGTLAVAGGPTGRRVDLTGTVSELNMALATLTYMRDAGFTGTDILMLSVDDQGNSGAGGAQVGTRSVDLVVEAFTNSAPDLLPISVTAPLSVGAPFEITLEATDIDGDTLIFQLNRSPEGASIETNGDNTATIRWTPSAGDVGIHDFEVLVVDDGTPPLADFEFFSVTVEPSLTVNTLSDEVDNDATNSLREAIMAANALAGTQEITFAPELDGGILAWGFR